MMEQIHGNAGFRSVEVHKTFQPSDVDKRIAAGCSRLIHRFLPASRQATLTYLRELGGDHRIGNNGLRWYLPTDVEVTFINQTDGFTQKAKAGRGILFGRLNRERLNGLQALLMQSTENYPLEKWNEQNYKSFMEAAQEIYQKHPIAGDRRIDCWPGKREKVEEGIAVDTNLNALDEKMNLGEKRLSDYVRVFRNSPTSDNIQAICVYVPPGKEFYFQGVSSGDAQQYAGGEKGMYVYLTVGKDRITGKERITAVEPSAFAADWRVKTEDGSLSDIPPEPKDFVCIDGTSEEIISMPRNRQEVNAAFSRFTTNERVAKWLKLLEKTSPKAREGALKRYAELLDEKKISVATLDEFSTYLAECFEKNRYTAYWVESNIKA